MHTGENRHELFTELHGAEFMSYHDELISIAYLMINFYFKKMLLFLGKKAFKWKCA